MKIAESPDFLESIANHPRVFPSVSRAGMTRIDLKPAWDSCIGFEFDTGGWLIQQLEPGQWEVHTLFLPKSRNVREKAAMVAFFMFTSTDAYELLTKVPADLPHARALAEAMGFRFVFRRENAWPRESGAVAVDYFVLSMDEWAAHHPRLQALGREFHEQLGEHTTHGEDAIHDAYVGLAVACDKAGRLDKGVWAYNRWARFAGYQPVAIAGAGVQFDNLSAYNAADGITIMENETCQQQA